MKNKLYFVDLLSVDCAPFSVVHGLLSLVFGQFANFCCNIFYFCRLNIICIFAHRKKMVEDLKSNNYSQNPNFMKKLILLIGILAFLACSYSQSVRIVLQTRLNFRYVEFDSIVLINTRTWDTLRKFYPDTILYSSSVGIEDYQQNAFFGFESNYRNPYSQETEVTLNVTNSEEIHLTLNDISGRKCQTFSRFFNPGIYKFRVSAKNHGFFVLNAKSKTYSSSIKLIQSSPGSENLITLIDESQIEKLIKSNPIKSDDSDFFNIGDRLIVRSYYQDKSENSFLYTIRNGYFIRDLVDDISCDSIDFTGQWYILKNGTVNTSYPTDEPFSFQNEVNFISDSVFSSTTLCTPSSSSIWITSTVGTTTYRKYKLFESSYENHPFSFYPTSTIIANINSYSESNTYSFHFFDCNHILLIPIGISYEGYNTLIRNPY